MRPAQYNHPYLVSIRFPEEAKDQRVEGIPASKGQLSVGSIVWLDHDLRKNGTASQCSAYLEGAGVIPAETHYLQSLY